MQQPDSNSYRETERQIVSDDAEDQKYYDNLPNDDGAQDSDDYSFWLFIVLSQIIFSRGEMRRCRQ